MEISSRQTGGCPSGSTGTGPRTRHKRARRMAPQAATCLLAATILVTVPAGPAQAESSEPGAPAKPSKPAAASSPAKPKKAGATAVKQPQLSAATLRQVKAYNKYRGKLARQKRRAKTAMKFARKQIGKPYRWGAAGPGAYDCSGLVMRSWQKAGVRIPRVTYSQYRAVRRKVSMKKLRPGDLVFFHRRGHVGMYVSKNRFIHAPSRGKRVRIDRLSGYRKRAFAGAVRPGAPAVKRFPASIVKIARELDKRKEAGKKKKTRESGTQTRPAGTPVKPQKVIRPIPSARPEPRPATTAHMPDHSGDIPLPSQQPLEDVLPATTIHREQAPPGP